MELFFELQNHQGHKREFNYRLLSTSSAQKFYQVTQECMRLPDNFPHGLSFGFRPNEDDLTLRVERMNALIRIINNEQVVFIEGDLVTADKLTQERLNYLHLKFHEYEERDEVKGSETQTARSLRELNILIHQIEQNRLLLNAPVFTQYLIFLLRKTIDVPMREEDHLAKTLELYHGDLILGYGTVGKSLFHCYKDNDLELIKRQMVRDQIVINSEVVCAFPQVDDDAQKAAAETRAFYDWCERHQVRDYGYDYRLPQHRPGNIPLGRLVQDYSYEDITEIFRNFTTMTRFEVR